MPKTLHLHSGPAIGAKRGMDSFGYSERVEIRVSAFVKAPIDEVWEAYVSPEAIKMWNFASEDWHTPEATVDLRVGGTFLSRMEAKDGSEGFDFTGTYTKIIKNQLIEYSFGDRTAKVSFVSGEDGVKVSIEFEAEEDNSVDLQRAGWQAILNNFVNYVEERSA
jgi:uncharacterized protein YndB with AHSA1/START domain